MALFKQKYTKPDPKTGERVTRESKKWYVRYRDQHGIVRTKAGYADKEATRQLLSQLERDAARKKAGLSDPLEEHTARPLDEHLDDFKAHLEAKERTADYIKMKVSRIRDALTSCSFHATSDIAPAKVETWLAAKRKAGLSAQTVNHTLGALRAFTKWLLVQGRIADDPLAHFSTKFNVKTDRRHKRRALSPDHFAALVAAARRGEPYRGLAGEDRGLLYLMAANSGLRKSELASLTPQSFALAANPATVTVRATVSKHRKEDVLPLHPEFVALLRPWLEARPAGKPCWPGTWHERASVMIKTDLAAAQIPYRDADDRVFDFHALRVQFISSLARAGVHPSRAQRLARHSTIELTMDTYTHLELEEAADALDSVDAASLGLGLTPPPEELTPPLTPTADSGSHAESRPVTERKAPRKKRKRRNSLEEDPLDAPGPLVSPNGTEVGDEGDSGLNGFLNRGSENRVLPGIPPRWAGDEASRELSAQSVRGLSSKP